MNTPEKISPDDPRLTAYALGEMEAAEREQFERLLQGDAAARAAIDEIRATVAALGDALETEPVPSVAAETISVDGIVPGKDFRKLDGGPFPVDEYRRGGSKLLRFPSLYFVTAGLAAAAFAVMFFTAEDREMKARNMALMRAQRVAASEQADRRVAMKAAAAAAPAPLAAMAPPPPPMVTNFAMVDASANVADQFVATAEEAVSTFPLHVSRESFEEVRTALRSRQRPAKSVVQVASLVNAFNYAWPTPDRDVAFATLLEETAAPWAPEHRLVRVGLRGAGTDVVARDAEVRVNFNPARVRAWRLVGFERDGALGVRGRAGETVRANDAVTALYEIVPAEVAAAVNDRTLLTLSLTYRDGATGADRELSRVLESRGTNFAAASADMKFAAGVAAFGLALRESPLQPKVPLEEIANWAAAGAGADEERREFVELMRSAEDWLH
jgi:hypothetical protein